MIAQLLNYLLANPVILFAVVSFLAIALFCLIYFISWAWNKEREE